MERKNSNWEFYLHVSNTSVGKKTFKNLEY